MGKTRRGLFILLTFLGSTLITVQTLALSVSVQTVQRLAGVEHGPGSAAVHVGRVTDRTLAYLYNFNQDERWLDAYHARERSHLREVHRRFWQARMVLAVVLVLLMVGIWSGWWRGIHLIGVMKTMLAVNFLIGMVIVFGFPVFFEVFHRLLFAPGSYLFYESDLLIRLFPFRFWFLMFVFLIGLNVAQALAVWMLGTLTGRRRFNRVSVRRGVRNGKY